MISVTVDFVVFGVYPELANTQVMLLLVKRGNDPFKDQWALPGGYVEEDETLVKAASRELEEETGFALTPTFQLHERSAVDRDPRGRVIAFPFAIVTKITDLPEPIGGDDAAEAKWFEMSEVALMTLAFDHNDIVKDAYMEVLSNLV